MFIGLKNLLPTANNYKSIAYPPSNLTFLTANDILVGYHFGLLWR